MSSRNLLDWKLFLALRRKVLLMEFQLAPQLLQEQELSKTILDERCPTFDVEECRFKKISPKLLKQLPHWCNPLSAYWHPEKLFLGLGNPTEQCVMWDRELSFGEEQNSACSACMEKCPSLVYVASLGPMYLMISCVLAKLLKGQLVMKWPSYVLAHIMIMEVKGN